MQLKVDLDRDRLADWFGQDGTRLVPGSALPDALVHQPSRWLLTELGLPREGGARVEFATGPELLLRPLAELLDGPSTGAEQLLVLGRVGCDRLVLDGVTGRIALAGTTYGQPAEVLIDLVASDLSVLLLFIHELEVLRADAADPSALDGLRGPAVVAEVTSALTERLRALDPAVFDAAGQAPLWSAVLLVHGLRWAARPGAWLDGPSLAYEITPELAAGIGSFAPVDPAHLPSVLAHPPTRQLLTRIGLLTSDQLRANEERPLLPLGERHPWIAEHLSQERAHQLDQVCLGETLYDCLVVVDGASGRLELTEGDGEEGWPAALLQSDLSAFYLTCWVLARLRAEAARWHGLRKPADWQVFEPGSLLSEAGFDLLAELDPMSVTEEDGLWRTLADDGHMGGLLGD
ncbi:SUKH-4 family immunity protein [Kitasatospora sp. NBC_01287]|uniref:SUKH-4 family immunity protein n=1 Tax=Kitasatospora sp. NBC_01287 TaxID=2903573 RepID=UPI00225688F1|nr:SUKH-4 family immunity protein [Kitasatospora sp. NBC_01287]MCX4744274.1 SUKH-4 family immunity protein [Kitasatospora sp. NBC_01287]